MRLTQVTDHSGVATMLLVNERGQVVAELHNVEMTASAALNPMFRQTAVHGGTGATA
jgi:hypothetical protein